MIDRQWIVLKSYVIPSKPHRNVVDVTVDDERWRPGPDVLWDANAAHQLFAPQIPGSRRRRLPERRDDEGRRWQHMDIRETRSCLTAPSCQRWPTDAYRRSTHDDDELKSLIALRNLFVDAEIWNNLMTWNHDLIAWPWLRIFNILHQVFPMRLWGARILYQVFPHNMIGWRGHRY